MITGLQMLELIWSEQEIVKKPLRFSLMLI
jgi:hypothetical protein